MILLPCRHVILNLPSLGGIHRLPLWQSLRSASSERKRPCRVEQICKSGRYFRDLRGSSLMIRSELYTIGRRKCSPTEPRTDGSDRPRLFEHWRARKERGNVRVKRRCGSKRTPWQNDQGIRPDPFSFFLSGASAGISGIRRPIPLRL